MIVWAAIDVVVEGETWAAAWLQPDDRLEAERHRLPGSFRNSLLARALTRALLFAATGCRDWQMRRDPHGKPFVVTPAGAPGPAISLSHSRDAVAGTVGTVDSLGIDIEYHRPRRVSALAAHAFGAREGVYVERHGLTGFYKVWTLREAVAKSTGEGLRLAANGRDLVQSPQNEGMWREGEWTVFSDRPLALYSLAIAWKPVGTVPPDVPTRLDPSVIASQT